MADEAVLFILFMLEHFVSILNIMDLNYLRKISRLVFLMIILSACSQSANAQTPSTDTVPATLAATPSPTTTRIPPTPTKDTITRPEWEQSPHALAEEPVECAACHRYADGKLTKEVAWYDEQSGVYQTVMTKGEVCQNCHDGYTHASNPHSNFGCVTCHNPHSTAASCKDCHHHVGDTTIIPAATPDDGHPNGVDSFCNGAACHASATQIAQLPDSGHPAQHPLVACAACHDASGSQVGPTEGGKWMPLRSDEAGDLVPFTSHDLQRGVDCQRCHFLDNPWALAEQKSDARLEQ